jgi:ATP synthase protein I
LALRIGMEVGMAVSRGPDDTGKAGPEDENGRMGADDDLDRRRRSLEASLARKLPAEGKREAGGRSGGGSGYGQAMKLSSEFIGGIAVGAGLGWVIDRWAGTSPWGLIVFLLLGFGAGILNVLRAAGSVAEAGLRAPEKGAAKPDEK